MFYRPADGHGLPHNPFNAIVTPRPIGWISTRGLDGSENLAPYSFFNAVAYTPPQVMFSTTGEKPDRPRGKDSLSNIEESGVFCVNIVGRAEAEAMNRTSGPYPREVDEFTEAGLERANCETIACSRVAGAPAALECQLRQVIRLEGAANFMVIGEVTGVHMRDDCLVDGRFDVTRFNPVSRLGYRDFAVVEEVFEMIRPGER
ncbi:flavin reductase family protein [Acidimangrovimonas sediminis]|uniref:flavin reductase family protein n=1 Tax=Acidimangrovimonas sediminis TaxID=2056283 RepID=UPI000C801629|nr:flavin reductase family protein [Acidimangrovimonas sediminis]